VRRLIVVLAAWCVAACASAGAPPGGPEDHAPPQILAITPESGQLNVRAKQIEFRFDEVVAQQALGASDLSRLFLISPREGEVDVSWHRSRITVKPHKGFRPNMAYNVTMLAGLGDLRNNVRKDGASIIFSTGPSVPRLGITGTVFDWAAQRTAANAYVEAMRRTDTNLVFIAVADSLGHFEIGPLDSGSYLVRGLIDQNSNRTIDRTEKWDSAAVHVLGDARPATELDAIERDSTPPLIANVSVDDSVTLHVVFDKYVDPAMPLQPALIDLRGADSSQLQVNRVQWALAFDVSKKAADSARKADSASRVRDTSRAAAQPPAAVAPRPPVGVPGSRPAPPPAKPKAPAPEKAIVIILAPTTTLVPGRSYRITTRGMRNLVGHASEQTRPFQVPVPKPAARDSTKRDSSRVRPDTTRPPPKPPL
jgi:Bacterial Ig-like domain